MTFEEYLKSQGLSDEQAAAIQGGMKENKFYLSQEENIDERYGKLKNQHQEASARLTDAQKLIEEMKKQTRDNEGLQAKISEYQKQAEEAEARAAKAEFDSAVKVELLANGADPGDIDYLMYRLENGDAEVKMGEDGKLSGIDDAVKALKTAHPGQFKGGSGEKGDLRVLENKLPEPGGEAKETPKDLADALRQTYESKE